MMMHPTFPLEIAVSLAAGCAASLLACMTDAV